MGLLRRRKIASSNSTTSWDDLPSSASTISETYCLVRRSASHSQLLYRRCACMASVTTALRSLVKETCGEGDSKSPNLVEFRVHWNPLEFLRRSYKKPPSLGEALTKGDGERLQSLLCGEYILELIDFASSAICTRPRIY
jgi:hypothetical protein